MAAAAAAAVQYLVMGDEIESKAAVREEEEYLCA